MEAGFDAQGVPPRAFGSDPASVRTGDWDDLVDRTPDPSPWLRPGWIGAWWRAFGRGHLELRTVERDGRVVAIAPLGRVGRRLVSPANYHTPAFELVGEDDEAVGELGRRLLADGPAHLRFRFLSPDGPTARALRAAATTSGYRLAERTLEHSPYVDTGPGWDAYHAGLDGKMRRELRRRQRRLAAEGHVEVTVADGRHELDRLLSETFRVEGLAWKARRGTAIASDPRTAAFYRDVARWAAARGTLRLACLRLDGRALAVDFAIEDRGRHYLLKTGYDPAFGKFAPGMIIRHMMLAQAFSEGTTTYDFLGLGSDYAWKREWTGTQQERLFVRMFAPTALGFLDRATFVLDRSALEQAKRLARSPVLGERGRRLLKRGHARVSSRLGR